MYETFMAFRDMFNFRDEKSTGRSMLMLNTFFCGICNVFITGTFYTGFLTNNGIDIVKVGIITFIPYFCWIFSLFGPRIMQKFKRRRGILIFNHVFYYTCVVLGTTVMPLFVEGSTARTIWFAVFLVLGNTSNALFGSGGTAWHINFIPDGHDRSVYFSLTNLVANLTGTIAALGASALTDALAGSPAQAQVIVVLRYVSYVLFVASGLAVFLVPKEYPYPVSDKHYSLKDVFFKPIHNKRFFYTILISVIWNCVGNFNAGTWTYYILNTVGMSYSLTYVSTIVCAIGGLFLLTYWRQAIRRYGWMWVIFINVLITVCVEMMMGLTTPDTIWLYVMGAVVSGLNLIGAQITFSNVFYVNLPKKDPDIYITFNNFIVNIFVFIGSMFGTWLLARLEILCAGHIVHGSQLLVWIKALCYIGLCVYIYKMMPHIGEEEYQHQVNTLTQPNE